MRSAASGSGTPGILAALLRTVSIIAILSAQRVAWTSELSVLRPGLWEYTTTAETSGHQPDLQRRCANPAAELQRVSAVLTQKGCKVAPLMRAADTNAAANAGKARRRLLRCLPGSRDPR